MIKRMAWGAVFGGAALLALILWQSSDSATAGSHQPRAVPTVYCDALSFSRADYNTAGAWPNSIAVGDFNADSVPDMAVANVESGTVSLLLGNGNGTFRAATPLPIGDYPTNVLTGTLRPDSRVDLITTFYGTYPTPAAVAVLLNNGSGVYATP